MHNGNRIPPKWMMTRIIDNFSHSCEIIVELALIGGAADHPFFRQR